MVTNPTAHKQHERVDLAEDGVAIGRAKRDGDQARTPSRFAR